MSQGGSQNWMDIIKKGASRDPSREPRPANPPAPGLSTADPNANFMDMIRQGASREPIRAPAERVPANFGAVGPTNSWRPENNRASTPANPFTALNSKPFFEDSLKSRGRPEALQPRQTGTSRSLQTPWPTSRRPTPRMLATRPKKPQAPETGQARRTGSGSLPTPRRSRSRRAGSSTARPRTRGSRRTEKLFPARRRSGSPASRASRNSNPTGLSSPREASSRRESSRSGAGHRATRKTRADPKSRPR